MTETIVTHNLDGVSAGLNRPGAELLCGYLFTERRLDWYELGGRIRLALLAPEGSFPLSLTFADAPVLRAVLDGVDVGDNEGLIALQLAVGSEPYPG